MNSTSATTDFIVAGKAQEAPLYYRLARRLEEYALLARFDRPIGTWLLLWPALWALWVAGAGRPEQKVLIVFALGVMVMRAAGCVINDFADRDIDSHVKRTRERPLAARRVSPVEALVLFVSYPLVKRFFPLPQLYLGISFGGWSVPMAFAAQRNSLPRIAWVLYIAAVIWAVLYDTIYAMVDREDDITIGIKSSAILFADMDRFLIGVLQAMMLLALVLAGRDMRFGAWYDAGLAAAGLLFLHQQWLIRARAPAACLRAFLNNNYVGMVIFVGVLLQYVYRR